MNIQQMQMLVNSTKITQVYCEVYNLIYDSNTDFYIDYMDCQKVTFACRDKKLNSVYYVELHQNRFNEDTTQSIVGLILDTINEQEAIEKLRVIRNELSQYAFCEVSLSRRDTFYIKMLCVCGQLVLYKTFHLHEEIVTDISFLCNLIIEEFKTKEDKCNHVKK